MEEKEMASITKTPSCSDKLGVCLITSWVQTGPGLRDPNFFEKKGKDHELRGGRSSRRDTVLMMGTVIEAAALE